MTPLERMALASVRLVQEDVADAIEAGRPLQEGEGIWLSHLHQARVQLLALAEAELPEEAIEAAQANPSQFAGDPTQWHIGSFRAMLRSIASEGKEDG